MPSPVRRWLPALLWVLMIYTTIPFVRELREWFVARWDPVWIGLAVATVLLTAGTATAALVRRQTRRDLTTGDTVWIVGATAVLVVWTFSLRRSPEESVHLVEYGALAVLLHRALRPSMGDALVFIAGALIGSFVGTVDEIIQWVSPGRYWDWRDLVLNSGAGALTQVILWRAVPGDRRPFDPASVRIVLRLASAQVILVILCLANTPVRVARYAPWFPTSGHLTSSLNPMAEYGHRHVVPGIGVFNSRLTLDALRREDAVRAIEVAGLLDEHRRGYGRFLDTWPVERDPFTYEARVHLFARDRNLAKAGAQDYRGSRAVEQLTVAWHENLLLEEIFGNTLNASSYRWSRKLRQRVEEAQDPDAPFRSAAGSNLITFASQDTIRTVLVLLLAGLIIADHRLGRSMRDG